MRQILLALFAVLLGSVIAKLGNALLGLTLVLRMNESGVPKQEIGLVAASFMAGFMIGGFYTRRIIEAIGHVRAFAGVSAVAAICTLLFPLLDDPWVWAGLRAIYGFTGAVSYIVFESWLNERATPETRGRVLSIYGTSNYLAITLGQLMINFTALGNFAFTLCAILVMSALIPVVSTRLPQPSLGEAARLSPRALYRQSPMAVVAVVGGGMISGALFGMNAVFAQGIGLDLLQVSIFSGSGVFSAFLFLWLIGRFSDRYGRRAALAGALGLVVLTSTLMAFSGLLGFGFPTLLALAILQGAPLLSVYHSAVAHAYDRMPRAYYVAASGSFQICFSVGSIIGPILVGYLMQHVGLYALFGYVAVISGFLLAFVFYRWKVRPQVETDLQSPTPKPPRGGVTS